MSEKLILDFPVLNIDSGDFNECVNYKVTAVRDDKNINITHTLSGASFIQNLVKDKRAVFSVLLVYQNSSERQICLCKNFELAGDSIIAIQTIPLKFSYAPKIKPSIVLKESQTIVVDYAAGLTGFWQHGERFDVPALARLAVGEVLQFSDGGLSSLMRIELDTNLSEGEMKTIVYEQAGEGDIPVTLLCGEGVFSHLQSVTGKKPPTNPVEAARSAIITQALCAVYAYMYKLSAKEQKSSTEEKSGGVLNAHLDSMIEKNPSLNWNNENFDPSWAATVMNPYAVRAIAMEMNND